MRSAPLVCVAALLVTGVASASPSAQDKAIASRLFDEGMKLMSSKRAAEACPKFADSERLDPQLGTLLHLGECYGKIGKSASAWACFRDAEEIANKRHDPRAPKIHARLRSLQKQLSNVVISVKDPAPGLEVRQDGEVVDKAAWGVPVPMDPGDHKVSASAPGRKPWESTIHVAVGPTTAHVDIPALAAAPADADAANSHAPAETPKAASAPASSLPPPTAESGVSTHPGSTRRLLGWTAVGAGAAGVVVGVVFQLQKSSKLSKRDAICPTGTCPSAEYANDQARINQLTSQARTDATISTVGFVAGGVLAAGGLVLLFTAPHAKSKTAFVPLLGTGFQGAMVQHAW